MVGTGATDDDGTTGFTLVRYLTNGSIDTSFGQGGIATTSLPGGLWSQAQARAVAIEPRLLLSHLLMKEYRWHFKAYTSRKQSMHIFQSV